MPDDYMASPGGETSTEKPTEEDPKMEGGETSLLPKSFFAKGCPMEIGSECSVKIVAIHGDEIEVECCGGDDDEKDDNSNQPEDSEDMDGAMGKLDAMAR
jgi:hypothetical protein